MSGRKEHLHPQFFTTHFDEWTYKVLNLAPEAHTPQAVLDAVKTFTSLYSNDRRTLSIAEFIKIYKRWVGRSSHDDLKQLITSGDFHGAMAVLDCVFFCGAFFGRAFVPNSPWNKHETALRGLHIEGNIFAKGHKGYAVSPNDTAWGLVQPLGNGQVAIYIDAFHPDGSPQTLENILETVVHEMAHAIFEVFACRCQSCNWSDAMVLGKNGHGRLWMEMAEHMRNTIRSWDEALNDFYDLDDIIWHNRNCN